MLKRTFISNYNRKNYHIYTLSYMVFQAIFFTKISKSENIILSA